MNVLQHTRNERNPCLKQNRPDRSYRDTLLSVEQAANYDTAKDIILKGSEIVAEVQRPWESQ